MKLKAIFVNVDILQTLILKSVVFAHEQLSADWYRAKSSADTPTPPSTARRTTTTSACKTSDYRRRLPPTLSSTSFVALFTSKAKRLLLCWCVLWPLKLNEHSKIIFFPFLLKNLKFVAAPLFTSLIDWKEPPPGGENDKMRFSCVTCLV